MLQNLTSKFIKVHCSNCKNEQVIFNKAATKVKCVICGETLAESTGSTAKIKAKIVQ